MDPPTPAKPDDALWIDPPQEIVERGWAAVSMAFPRGLDGLSGRE